jgi:PAS domain S-box-containing protein
MRKLLAGFEWLPVFALERVSDFIIVTDADLTSKDGPHIVFVNRALIEATGYAEAELLGRSPRIFQGEKTDRATLARIKSALMAGKSVSEEVLNYAKDGRPYWTELNISPISLPSRGPRLFLSVQRDITEKKRLSEEHERERRLIAASEKIGKLGTWGYDVAEDRMRWSDGTCTIFAIPSGAAPRNATEWLEYIAPDDRALMAESLQRCIRDAIPFETEFAGVTPGGASLRLVIRGEALLDDAGQTSAVLGAVHDITGQRDVADALSQSLDHQSAMERYFASARLSAKIGIFDYSVGEDLQYWSDELLEMTGLADRPFPAPAEAFISGIDKADRPQFDALFGRAIEHGEDYNVTVRFHRPDGRMMHMHIIAEVRDTPDDRRIVGIARDVTEEVEASARLKFQEERFRIIAGSVSDVLWDYDILQDDFWATPDWPDKLGVVWDDRPFVPARWIDYIVPEDRGRIWSSLMTALRSDAGEWRSEFSFKDVTGYRALVEINSTILRDENGNPIRALGNLRNITQERREQEGLTRSRALEAVGKMTGGVAHDFNNLLMIIQGNAELLAMSNLDDEDRESVQLINKATEAAANLTAKLLSFSGQTPLNNACLNIHDTIDELLPLLKSGLTSRIAIRSAVDPDIWHIEVDASALEQAIINLAVNARDAMPQGGTIEIAARNHVVSEDMVGATYDLAPGKYVCISVSDTGEGMSREVMAKACEPFFTTKDVGKGTGLGLSSAYGFARQSGGALQLYSELGCGTTIKLYLPASRDGVTPGNAADPLAFEPAHVERRVLVVEDEPDVRSHVEKLLSRAGFEVTSAENAHAALDILQGGETFDVLFTDVIMPGGMNGVQLAQAAANIAPQMKVLFTSGFPASAFEEVGVQAWETFDLLQKPYKSSELIRALRSLR